MIKNLTLFGEKITYLEREDILSGDEFYYVVGRSKGDILKIDSIYTWRSAQYFRECLDPRFSDAIVFKKQSNKKRVG